MLPLDPALFTLLNANAQTPAISIEAARAISSWLPSLCTLPVMAGLLRGSPALRRTLVLALLSMLAAWAVARLIRWGFPAPRPAQLGMGVQWVEHALRSSFPSMHATGAFALAQALTLGCTRHPTAAGSWCQPGRWPWAWPGAACTWACTSRPMWSAAPSWASAAPPWSGMPRCGAAVQAGRCWHAWAQARSETKTREGLWACPGWVQSLTRSGCVRISSHDIS